MRKVIGVAIVVALLAVGTAQAQGAPASGISLGARVGYGIPIGDADGGDALTPPAAMSDLVSGQLPLQLDITYRFNPNWQLGLYFQYGIAFASNTFCPSGVSCSGSDIRLGGEVMYTFASPGFSPWIGLGLGYEWLNLSAEAGGVSADFQVSGFEFLNLQVGGDWRLSPNFKMGPFVAFSIASYDSISVTVPGAGTVSGDIANTTTHEWLQFGLKGTFDL
ncbi:MAG TPA: hypothetical protein VFR85_21785 [Anaeromyxobacteraceae bacterium]|nr:hypothetical protein [Anaeromyxobacteraceae bacterium]